MAFAMYSLYVPPVVCSRTRPSKLKASFEYVDFVSGAKTGFRCFKALKRSAPVQEPLFAASGHGSVLLPNDGGRPMVVGSGRLSLTKPDEKSLGIPDLQIMLLVNNTSRVTRTEISLAYIQLTRKRAKSNSLPLNGSTVRRSQVPDVFVDGIIETDIASCMLIQQTKSGEDLGHTCYTILTVAFYMRDAWSLLVVLLGSVIPGPKSLIPRSHFDGV